MQIVINVNDRLVEYFANHNSMNDDGWFSHSSQLLNAFRNGTPLPKGHGKLIDVDTLEFRIVTVSYGYDWECGESTYANEEIVRVDDIWNAPAIVEADKEESEVSE